MTVIGAIFKVNSSIGKMCDLQGSFCEKDTLIIINFIEQFYNVLHSHTTIA